MSYKSDTLVDAYVAAILAMERNTDQNRFEEMINTRIDAGSDLLCYIREIEGLIEIRNVSDEIAT